MSNEINGSSESVEQIKDFLEKPKEFKIHCDTSVLRKDSDSPNPCVSDKQSKVFGVNQIQFSISSPDRKKGLTSIIQTLKVQKYFKRGELIIFTKVLC